MRTCIPFSSNREANQTFYMLVLGFLVILFISLFVFNNIYHLSKYSIRNGEGQAKRVVRLYRLANVAERDIFRSFKGPNNRVLSAKIALKPWNEATKMVNPTAENIHRWIEEKHSGRLSLRLPTNHWLNINIKSQLKYVLWPMIGFVSIAILLFFALLLLSGWAVKRLTAPILAFSEIAARLRANVHMPLVGATGNEDIDRIVDTLNQMRFDIQRLIGDHTQMLAAISHDLRTPITRLKLRAEYLEDSKQYEKIVADLDEMESMIKAFLTFAREQAQNQEKEPFDLNALLESLCDDLMDTGLEVSYQSDSSRVPFLGSINALKRALTNIIDNAVKYGQKAFVRLYLEESSIVIEIDDQGSGIPEEDLKDVFEPFYRAHKGHFPETTGVGLGLAIARNIIHSYGGDIALMNKPEGGLRVRIRFNLL